jgi:putative transposase
MVNYRRNRVAGGTYFFTIALHDRGSTALIDYIDHLRNAFQQAQEQQSFVIDAMVVMPDHLHSIWTLPPNDADYPGRWRSIKSHFSRELAKADVALIKDRRGEYNLWQKRYWEHTIRDETDMTRHVDYVHYNPVKHGYVTSLSDWPYSSFHRFVKAGIYPADWGSMEMDFDGVGNE